VIMFLLPKTPSIVIGCLTVIFILLIHPIWNFWWIEQSLWLRMAAILLVASCLCFLGYSVYPNQLGIRTKLYKEFMEEKIRRIAIYERGAFLELVLKSIVSQQNQPHLQNNPRIEEDFKYYYSLHMQWQKDKAEEHAKFVGLSTDIQLHFKESVELQRLIKLVNMPPPIKFEDPNQDDLKNDDSLEKWITIMNKFMNEYITIRIKNPLNELEDYLKANLK